MENLQKLKFLNFITKYFEKSLQTFTMQKVLCVSYLEKGKKLPITKVLNKEFSELQNDEKFNWIVKALKSGIGPMGVELEPCAWHSGACHKAGDINNPSLCYTDNPPDFGIWTSNYNVIDTCHIREKFDKQLKSDLSRRMFKFIDELPSQNSLCENLNKEFIQLVEEKNTIKNQIENLERKFKTCETIQNPEYIKLKNIEKINQDFYDKRKIHTINAYESFKDKNVSIDEFLEKQLSEEKNKLIKSQEAVHNWYNSNILKDKTKDLDNLHLLKTKFKNLDSESKKSYAIPFAYIYKLRKNLNELEAFYVNQGITNRPYTLEKIREDISWCKINLSLYNEFLGNENPEDIVKRVENEQIKAAQEERFIKSTKTVHKITPAATTYVVLPDGSIKTIEVKNQKIIGKTIDTSNEWRLPDNGNDKWTKVR